MIQQEEAWLICLSESSSILVVCDCWQEKCLTKGVDHGLSHCHKVKLLLL